MNSTSNSSEIQNKTEIYIFRRNPNSNRSPTRHLFHSFGPGTFALNSHTYNPLFGKILDPPLIMNSNGTELQQVVH